MERDDLLKKAGAWDENLPHNGVELIIHPMDYTFFSPGIFSRDKSGEQMMKHFKEVINYITTSYAAKWAEKEMTEKGKNLKKQFLDFALFKEQLDLKKIYSEISDGENPASIYLPISNVLFEIKRFGDSLGINLKSGKNQANEIHINGTELLMGLCQENFILQEFFHSIEIIIPLNKKPEADGAVSIDFENEWIKIGKPFPGFSLIQSIDFPQQLIDAYVSENIEIPVGYYKTEKTQLIIMARLVHMNADSDGTVSQRNWDYAVSEKQWRKGNVEQSKDSSGTYIFSKGNDFCLSISIESGLPECSFLKKINLASMVSYNQLILKTVSSSLYLQLCAHQLAESGQRA